MARYPLYVHHEVDAWVEQHPSLRRRVDWVLAELAARGVAGRPKGLIGPARDVRGLPGHRWRRSGIGGFEYYAWWFEAGQGAPFPPGSRVVRAIRHHDVVEPLGLGEPVAFTERAFEQLEPLSDEQAAVVQQRARVRLAVGYPGTGKTGALLYAVVEELRLRPGSRLLYVTLSPRLADDARQFLEGLSELAGRVDVVTYEEVLARWTTIGARQWARILTDEAEERAFLGFVAEQPRRDVGVWQNAPAALWAEVRAHVIGRALPFPLEARGQPAMQKPFLDLTTYRRLREEALGVLPARAAWRLAERFVGTRQCPTLHQEVWNILGRILEGRLDQRLRSYAGLLVDEIQDLTLLQLALLVEAVRRLTVIADAAPCFIAAGDESQVVHPSGFDWGVCKDLLRERLGTTPVELQLLTNQRSPAALVKASNRTATLYDTLPREHRPQARVEVAPTEAGNGRVYLCRATRSDPELVSWLRTLATTPGSALLVCPGARREELAARASDLRLADRCFEPALVKGLDLQYVVIWDASRVLRGLRDELQAARSRGDGKPRYLAARRQIDAFRVAVSRANETLVFLDLDGESLDPLLEGLEQDGIAQTVSPAYLRHELEARGSDPVQLARSLFAEASALLDVDLPRALRLLERGDGALANVLDPGPRREVLEQRIEARRRAAHRFLAQARAYAGGDDNGAADAAPDREEPSAAERASEQWAAVAAAYRELSQTPRAEAYTVLSERYSRVPPSSGEDPNTLLELFERVVAELAELPPDDPPSELWAEARAWRDELIESAGASPACLKRLLSASERLAALTGQEEDAAAGRALRLRLAERQIAGGECQEALRTLREVPQPPPSLLARCHECLGDWAAAAGCYEEAGELSAALENYRRAGQRERAVEIAERLGRGELASALRTLQTLLESLGQFDVLADGLATHLLPEEQDQLADRLRWAAERVRARQRRNAERRR